MNASHATEGKKGVIEIITSRAEDNGVEIIIKDNGEGIPAEIIDKIYDPFFTTKDVDKGTGLGLNIVYNLIEKHGGEINIESTVGLGTTCTIKLPPKPPNG
jgi:signal transduction histidine kinase